MAELIQSDAAISVGDVIVRDRIRPVSEAGIAALIASINELGTLKDPIHLRRKKDGKLYLLAGAHRLEAAKRLKWGTIRATVWQCTDDWARLMEIDDNLAGAELTALDTAVFLARRKEVYERMHPQTKAAIGAELAAKRWNADASDIVSFASATAEKFGISKRHVERLVMAGHRLNPQDLGQLRRAPRPVTLKDLMVIGKVIEPAERYAICDLLGAGTAKSAAKALAAHRAKTAPEKVVQDTVEAELKGLRDAWSRASKQARRRFVAAHLAEVEELLDGSDDDDAEGAA